MEGAFAVSSTVKVFPWETCCSRTSIRISRAAGEQHLVAVRDVKVHRRCKVRGDVEVVK